MTTGHIERRFEDLRKTIEAGNMPPEAHSAKEFGGADVIIKKVLDDETRKWLGDQPQVLSLQGSQPRRRVVITEHAHELSWLFCQLRDTAADRLDSISKYDFYGALAGAALAFLDEKKAAAECKDLLLRVLDEARGFLGDEA